MLEKSGGAPGRTKIISPQQWLEVVQPTLAADGIPPRPVLPLSNHLAPDLRQQTEGLTNGMEVPMDRIALLTGEAGSKRLARFWDKVDQRGDCWLWTGATGAGGYGIFKLAPGCTTTAHRLSLVHRTGVDPSDKEAGHLCDNARCVRPAHLEWQTRAENEAFKRTRLTTNTSEVRNG